MADDPTADVTIRNEATQEERVVAAGSVAFFTNPESGGWVVLDAAGRRKANQPAPATTHGKDV